MICQNECEIFFSTFHDVVRDSVFMSEDTSVTSTEVFSISVTFKFLCQEHANNQTIARSNIKYTELTLS